MPDFITSFMKHTATYESPTSFWRWAAYASIAGTLRDSCFRQMGEARLYPNVFVLILAPSAMYRKGHPVHIAEKLVKSVQNTKVISGRSSIQGILDELARGETDKKTGKLSHGGSAFFCAPELSAGIVNDPEAIKILTDIYDFKEEYTSRLRGAGVLRIKNICFTMLGASNEELLKDLYTNTALYGGLLGRTFLIKPDEFRPSNSLFTLPDTSEEFQALKAQLLEISRVNGEFKFTADAQNYYEAWYAPFRASYRDKADKSGIAGRIHTSALKLAMILCVNHTLDITIQQCHIREAIDACVGIMPNYTSFVINQGKATINECATYLIDAIEGASSRTITKADFLTAHFHLFDLEIVDRCVATLIQAGLMTERIGGSETTYSLTEKCRKAFNLIDQSKGKGSGI